MYKTKIIYYFKIFFPIGGMGKGHSLKKQKANDVKVRFIIKEAEYLMRCGRYTQVRPLTLIGMTYESKKNAHL